MFLLRTTLRHSLLVVHKQPQISTLASWRATAPTLSIRESDVISLSRIQGLVSTLELPPDGPADAWSAGARLPPGFSLLLFRQTSTPLSELNADGTEPGGGLHPPGGLERMWVGGEFEFLSERQRMRVGDAVESVGVVEGIKERVGRDGRAGLYVTTRREMGRQGQEPSVVERRTHLYRAPGGTAGEEPARPTQGRRGEADFATAFTTTPKMLFRFSALTFNTHRIHWDLDYCLSIEKRPGLIVHGPLTSLLLLSALRHNTKTVNKFSYRATKPLVVGTEVWFCGKWEEGRSECAMWVEDAQGEVYMTGRGEVDWSV